MSPGDPPECPELIENFHHFVHKKIEDPCQVEKRKRGRPKKEDVIKQEADYKSEEEFDTDEGDENFGDDEDFDLHDELSFSARSNVNKDYFDVDPVDFGDFGDFHEEEAKDDDDDEDYTPTSKRVKKKESAGVSASRLNILSQLGITVTKGNHKLTPPPPPPPPSKTRSNHTPSKIRGSDPNSRWGKISDISKVPRWEKLEKSPVKKVENAQRGTIPKHKRVVIYKYIQADHGNETPEELTCPECQTAFNSTSVMNKHRDREHDVVVRYSCPKDGCKVKLGVRRISFEKCHFVLLFNVSV